MKTRANRHRNLTWGLLGLLLVPPFTRPLFPGAAAIGPLIFVVLVSRSLMQSHGSRLFRTVLATAMVAVALRVMGASAQFLRESSLEGPLRLLAALGFTFVLLELFKSILADGPVTADRLYAAVSAFLVLGLVFASLYEAIAAWTPVAFSGAYETDADSLVYFSLVTLSTVGYGDVVPNVPQTRMLAVSEAIAGQFYLAILVARLVGLHMTQSNGSEPAKDLASPPPDPPAREHEVP